MTLPPENTTPFGQRRILARPVVLTGMMGSGKSSVGRRLAARLAVPFADSDQEIESAAGCSIAQFFERYGEEEFRAGEQRVIARLLEQPMLVLSIGGGAFIHEATRELILQRAVAVWLKVDAAILVRRIGRRADRPLLMRYDDPAAGIAQLLEERAPIYAEAHITVEGAERPIEEAVSQVIDGLVDYAASCHEQNAKYLVIA